MRENTREEWTVVEINEEYQMAGETQADTSKLIQERKEMKSEMTYPEIYIQPEIAGRCEQFRVVQG